MRPLVVDYAETAPHIYVVRVDERPRQDLMDFLASRGVGSAVHYLPNHRQPHFARYATDALPVTERLGREILTLPLHCALDDADVERVVDAVVAWDRSLA